MVPKLVALEVQPITLVEDGLSGTAMAVVENGLGDLAPQVLISQIHQINLVAPRIQDIGLNRTREPRTDT